MTETKRRIAALLVATMVAATGALAASALPAAAAPVDSVLVGGHAPIPTGYIS